MQRSTPITLFGILNIVFGVFAFFGVITTLAMLAMPDTGKNPILKLIHENATYAAWVKLTIPLGLVAGVVLITAGIGLLRMCEWARKLSIAYGVYGILMDITLGVINYLFIFRPLFVQVSQASGTSDPAAVGGAIGAAVAGVLGAFFGLVYPGLLIIFMTRPKIAASFRPPAEPPNLPNQF